MAIVPGHLAGGTIPNGGALYNVLLRVGTVQKIFFPEDEENVSKKFIEYQVLVQHRANGTAVTKMYDHCIAIDHLASFADFSFSTYRAQNTAISSDGENIVVGHGAHVMVLCLNGESNNAVILGGIRQAESVVDAKADGHHHHSRFNGVDLQINKDGELTLTYGGAETEDAKTAEGVEKDSIGTYVKIDKLGNVTISDAKGENLLLVDRLNGNVRVVAKEQADVIAPKVTLGDPDADEPLVLGNQWKEMMDQLIDAILQLTVPTPDGPSGTPINASAFSSIKSALRTKLSGVSFTK